MSTAPDESNSSRWRQAAQLALAVALLAGTLAVVDAGAVAAELSRLRAPWVVLGAAVSLPQLALCAARWRFTAGRLGLPLSVGRALGEYYLSSFANQVLPFGVLGDAMRVARHARDGSGEVRVGQALHAVLLERASGQLVIGLWVVAALPLWLGAGAAVAAACGAAALAVVVLLGRLARNGAALLPSSRAREVVVKSGHALLAGRALPVQLALSSLVALTLLAQYQCAARALGVSLPGDVLARVTPLVLASMALPLSFGGWGAREAVNAALFDATGLDAATGAAIGVSYGLMSLLGSAPALWLLARSTRWRR